MAGLLEKIHKGMEVYDSEDARIGTVEDLKFGQEEAVTTQGQTQEDAHTLIDDLAEALWPGDMPEAQRALLLREGYVLLDANGILHKDRYIRPEQIRAVTGNKLVLNVRRRDLMAATHL